MTLVDRFVCRREGHKPTARLTGYPAFVTTYITTCQRCGKHLELSATPPEPEPKPIPPRYTEHLGG